MFFLQYKAVPLPDGPAATDGTGGAFVNCWIERPTVVEAELVAKQMIEADGWQVVETLEVQEASDADYGLGEGAHSYFKQAQLDGEVLVFHTYPDRDEDDT